MNHVVIFSDGNDIFDLNQLSSSFHGLIHRLLLDFHRDSSHSSHASDVSACQGSRTTRLIILDSPQPRAVGDLHPVLFVFVEYSLSPSQGLNHIDFSLVLSVRPQVSHTAAGVFDSLRPVKMFEVWREEKILSFHSSFNNEL